MTAFAYLLVASVFVAWYASDRRERRMRQEWWGQWHQAPAFHVVRELYDWQREGL